MYRIMIVDDEKNILHALRRALDRQFDWEIETCHIPCDALKRARATTFDLFLSDYRMPDMDGVQFLCEAKALQPEAMRLILSGHTDLKALTSAINQAEIYRFISKPWEDYDLTTTLIQALIHRDTLTENRHLADQVRAQQQELDKRKLALEQLKNAHPTLFQVDWDADGSVLLDEE
ncbi:MAG: response regulator [Gammaproteobacteria bacterium]|nr:response regulator [Gammaproteobacteria bacterium]MCF6337210.1 response regulator [Gammaproteobacteria bacterium]